MTEEIIVPSLKVKKKSIFKKWWFWALVVIVVVIVASVSSQSSSTIYELGKMNEMNKQQIIEKLGKPDEIVRDDKDGYSYGYFGGFNITGTEEGANNIVLSSDFVKNKTSNSYKIFDIQLDSSFAENVKRLGKPQLNLKKDNKNLAVYLTKEGLLLSFSSKSNEDKVSAIELSEYDSSSLSPAFEIGKLLENKATESDIKQNFTIKNKSSNDKTTLYVLEGFELTIDNDRQTVSQVTISTDSIYNILGVRMNYSLDKANKLFGNPIQTKEGVKNTTQYSYSIDNQGEKNRLLVSVDSTSKKAQYIELSLK